MHININNRVHCHSADLIKAENIETKAILMDEKNFGDLFC